MRGRPKKKLPQRGDEVLPGDSQRIICIKVGMHRQRLRQCLALASIPKQEFEDLIEAEEPMTVRGLELLVRRRTGKAEQYIRRCPHCSQPIKIEDAR
jgi:hypothetical protein